VSVQFSRNLATQYPAKLAYPIPQPIIHKKMGKILKRIHNRPICAIMAYYPTYRRKPVLSLHQKEMRFITALSVFICTLVAFAFFWLVSRPEFIGH